MVVNYDGLILAQADTGPGEKVVVAPIDINSLRAERDRRKGHDMRAHFRSEIHDYSRGSYLSPAGDSPTTIDDLKRRIKSSKSNIQS